MYALSRPKYHIYLVHTWYTAYSWYWCRWSDDIIHTLVCQYCNRWC